MQHIRPSLELITDGLVVPHGFTLTIAGSFATLVGERGYPGAFDVWLFVLGANAAFLLCRTLSRQARSQTPSTATITWFNVVPTLTIPVVYGSTQLIHPDGPAFLAAGAASVGLYITLLSTGSALAQGRASRRAG